MDKPSEGSERLNDAIVSVRALASILKAVIQDPTGIKSSPTLEVALRSQGMLAKYSDAEGRIHPMSLNHMKKVCEAALGSFSAMDELRRAAARAIGRAREPTPPKGQKASLLEKIEILEEEKRWLLQDLFILQRAYDTRCTQARSYAKLADAATRSRCKKEQAELDASFSLRKIHTKPGNVSSIEDGKRRETSS